MIVNNTKLAQILRNCISENHSRVMVYEHNAPLRKVDTYWGSDSLDVDFVSFSQNLERGEISYLVKTRFLALDSNADVFSPGDGVRTRCRPGKFFKKVYPNATALECETFAKNVSMAIAKMRDGEEKEKDEDGDELLFGRWKFKIVKGDELVKYYFGEHYEVGIGHGTLNDSCMRYGKCQDYIKSFYGNNPEVCQMAIMLDEKKDLISARSLLWTDKDGKEYFDRVYYCNSDIQYAMAQKLEALGRKYIFSRDGIPEIETYRDEIIVKLEQIGSTAPYMDSLMWFNDSDLTLSNDSGNGNCELTSQHGSIYGDEEDNPSFCCDDCGDEADEDDCVTIDRYSVTVCEHCLTNYYVYSEVEGTYIRKDDAVEDVDGEYISKENAVQVLDVDSYLYDIKYTKDISTLKIGAYMNKYIHEDSAITVYLCVEHGQVYVSDSEVEYVPKSDACLEDYDEDKIWCFEFNSAQFGNVEVFAHLMNEDVIFSSVMSDGSRECYLYPCCKCKTLTPVDDLHTKYIMDRDNSIKFGSFNILRLLPSACKDCCERPPIIYNRNVWVSGYGNCSVTFPCDVSGPEFDKFYEKLTADGQRGNETPTTAFIPEAIPRHPLLDYKRDLETMYSSMISKYLDQLATRPPLEKEAIEQYLAESGLIERLEIPPENNEPAVIGTNYIDATEADHVYTGFASRSYSPPEHWFTVTIPPLSDNDED